MHFDCIPLPLPYSLGLLWHGSIRETLPESRPRISHNPHPPMKTIACLLTIATTLGGLVSCEKKAEPAKTSIGAKIDDALDRRPNEKLKDAVEDLEKDAKKAGEGITEALDKAAKDLEKDLEKSK